MAILYSYQEGKFISLDKKHIHTEFGEIEKIYVNLTNRCPCSCTFCIRNNETLAESKNLWLDVEPSSEDVISEFERLNLMNYNEVIFCGYGEPLTRLEQVIQVSKYLKKRAPKLKTRLNTNGLGDLINEIEVAPLLANLIDSVSISLNAANAEEYLRITKSIYGIRSYDAMFRFAITCKRYIKDVRVTIVDIIGKHEIEKCIRICEKNKLNITVREFR